MSTDAHNGAMARADSAHAPGIVAEVHVDHDRLLLRPTLRRLGEGTIVPENRATRDGRRYQFVSIEADSVSVLDTALAADPTVADPLLVERQDDRLIYRVQVTDSALTIDGAVADRCGRIRDASITPTGWVLKLRLPTREALIEFNDECKGRDISVSVTQLRTADLAGSPLLGLTEKQQELLTVAYQEGYFDVPRGISQDELAAALGVSKSAISQRLRRAMSELCASSFDGPFEEPA
ncbi:helix-turn-helix domain-containing protein [Halovivax limisalsi]|uniref:helix-turn-helix domain-containing protein n=1 Tax=Halovivax limisalsi TaxID=1453760 RepID=UPI001FFD15AD|nr:helix-turn-helix domain-containing protein [Halovivax limisalsi]